MIRLTYSRHNPYATETVELADDEVEVNPIKILNIKLEEKYGTDSTGWELEKTERI